MIKKRTLITSLIVLATSIIVSIFAFVPVNRIHSGYSKTWMSQVSDDAKIKEMSLPGSHDSGATHSIADVAGKCQDLDIKTQLNIGVRFLDLRIQLINDEFIITHAFVKQNLTLKEVLDDIDSFLNKNNEEFLLLSIKEEESSVDSSLNYNEALKRDLVKYDTISLDNILPTTLGEARGKAYVLSRSWCDFGVPCYSGWRDDTSFDMNDLYVQDNYNIQDVEEKKNNILDTIEYANNNPDKLVLNFTSCYLDPGFPPSYAGTTALAINPWLESNIKNSNSRLGILIIDFVTESLSKTIYMRNVQ